MARIVDAASSADYCKIAKGNLDGVSGDAWCSTDMEVFVGKYADLLVDLLRFTDRPTKSKVVAAMRKVFSTDPNDADTFGNRVARAISWCRIKC
eukprot:5163561-Alexandrium_andersonii.AAC.1